MAAFRDRKRSLIFTVILDELSSPSDILMDDPIEDVLISLAYKRRRRSVELMETSGIFNYIEALSTYSDLPSWDHAYDRELKVYKDVGDVGEIWFGEDSQERVLDWIEDSDFIKPDESILDLGCGNGVMLVELSKRGYTNLTGVDYSEAAIQLAQSITTADEISNITYQVADLICDDACEKYSCLTRKYKVVLDKGTYDAISLMPSVDQQARFSYLKTVKNIIDREGFFIITSCNWTKEQLLNFFEKDFHLHTQIRTPSFQFGGKKGNTVTSLVFQPNGS